ncbi:MAG TPA: STAS domain-containing protein, partial [Steroidobacteraceae bacterium]|nr:STAS domain-containing protein [Steroidobacteraceae bacterium]
MKTRRKPGSLRKKAAAPHKRATTQRTVLSAQRAAPTGKPKSKTASASATVTVLAPLAADCTIAQAGTLKSRLTRALTKLACVTLDLAAVRRVDTAGIQVLAAFIRERRAAGRDVDCQGMTEAFRVTAQLLGLGALFGPVVDGRLSAPAAG